MCALGPKGAAACWEVDLRDGALVAEVPLPKQLRRNPKKVVVNQRLVAGVDGKRRLVAFAPESGEDAKVLAEDALFVAAAGDALCAITQDK